MRLDGSVPQKQRQQLVSRFQTEAGCRVFLTTNAGATGLNLQAADTVINLDLPWNPALLEQRIARAHRMGQKRPVQVYLLITEDTIEENLLATLSAKHELAAAVLDPDSDLREVQLASGIEELKRRLEAAARAPSPKLRRTCPCANALKPLHLVQRRERVAEAGGHLLAAAFSFLGEILPASGHPRLRRKPLRPSRPVFGNAWRPARTARSISPSRCPAWRRWMGWPLRWRG